MHNIHYLLSLMSQIRQAILQDQYPAFLEEFFDNLYGDRTKSPGWAIDALNSVGIDLLAK